jgi:hypothetical protein
VIAQDGDYTQIFGELWRKSLTETSNAVVYEMESFDVRDKMEYPEDVDRYSAIVYTGSGG